MCQYVFLFVFILHTSFYIMVLIKYENMHLSLCLTCLIVNFTILWLICENYVLYQNKSYLTGKGTRLFTLKFWATSMWYSLNVTLIYYNTNLFFFSPVLDQLWVAQDSGHEGVWCVGSKSGNDLLGWNSIRSGKNIVIFDLCHILSFLTVRVVKYTQSKQVEDFE